MKRAIVTALAVLATFGTSVSAGAQDADPDPEHGTAWQNQQMIALVQRDASQNWETLAGGLKWRRVAGNGTGPAPTLNDVVTLHYAGTLVDGTEFDSSYARNEPATFPLGSLIRAWQIAVPYMGVGDTIEIAVPAELGYGARGGGPIPGGATLLFKIELLAIPSQQARR